MNSSFLCKCSVRSPPTALPPQESQASMTAGGEGEGGTGLPEGGGLEGRTKVFSLPLCPGHRILTGVLNAHLLN